MVRRDSLLCYEGRAPGTQPAETHRSVSGPATVQALWESEAATALANVDAARGLCPGTPVGIGEGALHALLEKTSTPFMTPIEKRNWLVDNGLLAVSSNNGRPACFVTDQGRARIEEAGAKPSIATRTIRGVLARYHV